MKGKKLVALLLAVMLMVASIPLNASATGDDPQINIILGSTGTFGSFSKQFSLNEDGANALGVEYNEDDPPLYTVDTLEKYKNFTSYHDMASGDRVSSASNAETRAAWYEVLKDAGETSTVAKGETVYLTVKVTAPTAQYGVVPSLVAFRFDTDAFDYTVTEGEVVSNYLGMGGSGQIINSLTQITSENGKTYGGGLQYPTDKQLSCFPGGEGLVGIAAGKSGYSLQYGYGSKAVYPNATGTTWDYVIPFTAKKAGTYTIEAIPKFTTAASGESETMMYLPKQAADGSTRLDAPEASDVYKGTAVSNITYGKTTITVTAPPVVPEISSVAYDTGVPTITFTKDEDHAAAGDLEYQIEGTSTWTSLSKAATDGTVDAENNTWTLGSTVIDALAAGKKVLISADKNADSGKAYTVQIGTPASGDTGYAYTEINQVEAGEATNALTFNYSTLKVQANSGWEIKVPKTSSASLDAETRETSVEYEYTTDPVDFELGATITYRKQGDNTGIASADATGTAASAGTLSVTVEEDRTTQLQGKTKLSGVANDDKYFVGENEPTWSEISDAFSGSDFTVDATDADTIWVYRAGTSSDPYKVGSVTGNGFGAPTINKTDPSETSDPVVLTIAGAKGEFSATTTGITVEADNTPVSTGTVTRGDADDETAGTNDKITIAAPSSGWTKEVQYTVKVTTGSTTPNLEEAYEETFTISDNGYVITKGEVKHNNGEDGSSVVTFSGKTGIQPGAEVPIAYSGLKDYESLTTASFTVTGGGSVIAVTPSDDPSKAGEGTFTYKAPGTAGTTIEGKPGVTIAVNTGKASKALSVDSIDTSGANYAATKTYDGTTNAPADLESPLDIDSDDLFADGKNGVQIAFTGATYDHAGVSEATTITLTGVTVVSTNDGDDDATYYSIPSTLTFAATIDQAALSDVEIGGVTLTGKTEEAIAAAINGATVTLNSGADSGKFSEIFPNADLSDAIEAAVIDAGRIKNDPKPMTVETPAEGVTTLTPPTIPDDLKVGDVISVTLPEGYTLVSVAGTGYTDNGDGTVTVTTDAANQDLTITYTEDAEDSEPKTEKTLTVTGPTTIGDAEADYTKLAVGDTLTINIDGTNIDDWASDTVKANYKNLTSASSTVSVGITSSPVVSGPSGYGVSFDTKG